VAAPPVYDPGGASLLVDDLWVASPELWPNAGAALLDVAAGFGRGRGAAQLIVIAPMNEPDTSDCLAANGLVPVSCWWTRKL
jgi:hypothetical protein